MIPAKASTARVTGVIVKVVVDRGFGFVERDEGGGDIFFHVRCLSPQLTFDATLQEQRVSFNVIEREKGKMATDIRPA